MIFLNTHPPSTPCWRPSSGGDEATLGAGSLLKESLQGLPQWVIPPAGGISPVALGAEHVLLACSSSHSVLCSYLLFSFSLFSFPLISCASLPSLTFCTLIFSSHLFSCLSSFPEMPLFLHKYLTLPIVTLLSADPSARLPSSTDLCPQHRCRPHADERRGQPGRSAYWETSLNSQGDSFSINILPLVS